MALSMDFKVQKKMRIRTEEDNIDADDDELGLWL